MYKSRSFAILSQFFAILGQLWHLPLTQKMDPPSAAAIIRQLGRAGQQAEYGLAYPFLALSGLKWDS